MTTRRNSRALLRRLGVFQMPLCADSAGLRRSEDGAGQRPASTDAASTAALAALGLGTRERQLGDQQRDGEADPGQDRRPRPAAPR